MSYIFAILNYTYILLVPKTINNNMGHCQGENIYFLKLLLKYAIIMLNITWFILGTCGIWESKNTFCQFYVIVQVQEKEHSLGCRQTCVQLPALFKVMLCEAGQLFLGTRARIKLNNAYFKMHSMGTKWMIDPFPNLFTLKQKQNITVLCFCTTWKTEKKFGNLKIKLTCFEKLCF